MEFLKLLLNGNDISTMRLMSLLSLLSGIGIAIFGLVKGSNLGELSILVGVFVGAAFTGKTVQAFAEKNQQ